MSLTAAQLYEVCQADSSGDRIRAARLALELTQVQLAAELGLTQSTLSYLERQRSADVTVETARKFAEFFGCAIEDLFPARADAEATQ